VHPTRLPTRFGQGLFAPVDNAGVPAVMDAFQRVRSEPTDHDAEQHLAAVLLKTDEMLLSLEGMPGTAEIVYKSIAAPIFDPIGRVLLSLNITGPEHPARVDRLLEFGCRLVQSATIATRQARGRMPGPDAPPPG
jgi:hypothetical protein